jgi:hypothetical protein
LRIILILINILFAYSLYAINDYTVSEIGKIKTGNGKGELGYNPIPNPGGGPPQPTVFSIDTNGDIYVYYRLNNRINIYSVNLSLRKVIIDNFNIIYAYAIKNDNIGNIYISGAFNFFKFGAQGDLLYKINNNLLSTDFVSHYNYFPLDGIILFYTDDKKIKIIDESGKIISFDEEASLVIKKIKNRKIGDIFSADEIKEKAYNLCSNENLFIDGNRLLTTNGYKYFNVYLNFLQSTFNKKQIPAEIYDQMFAFMGFDSDDNVYWSGMKGLDNTILVFSKYGELIDNFYFRFVGNQTVSSKGDVYCWKIEKDYVTFYKVTRRWGLDQESSSSDTTKLQPIAFAAKATALTATSFIDYQKMYTPYRVFDNDPKTAWLEAAKASGIDEAVSLSLDKEITVDEIQVMPGYFDPQWWKTNNRIKKLVAVATDQAITFNFEDKMEEQSKKLDKPLTFSKIKFAIKDVYRSTGDDDTALSEISFWNKGKKLEIDLSGVK